MKQRFNAFSALQFVRWILEKNLKIKKKKKLKDNHNFNIGPNNRDNDFFPPITQQL